jgi:hypothetical protein
MQPTPENDLNLERARLEAYVMDYVRAGWTVTDQTGSRVRLAKNDQVATLSLDGQGQVVVDGPPLTGFVVTGRMKAWLILLLILVIVFVLAGMLGYFRV